MVDVRLKKHVMQVFERYVPIDTQKGNKIAAQNGGCSLFSRMIR